VGRLRASDSSQWPLFACFRTLRHAIVLIASRNLRHAAVLRASRNLRHAAVLRASGLLLRRTPSASLATPAAAPDAFTHRRDLLLFLVLLKPLKKV
jgi:hypothetical protein